MILTGQLLLCPLAQEEYARAILTPHLLFGEELNLTWYQSPCESLWSLPATGHCDCLRRLVPELQQMGLAWRPIPIL